MNKRKLFFAPLIAILVFVSGCEQKAEDEIDFGVFNDSVYQNKYLGLTVSLPPEWSIQDREAQQRIMDLGSEIVAGDDQNLKAALKASELTTVNLFAAFQYPVGTPVAFNPGIMCLAEKVSHTPGVERGRDYLLHTRMLFKRSKMEVYFPEEISTETVGNHQFDVMHTEIAVNDMWVRQKYYATIIKGYALVFIGSFTTDLEQAAMDKILKTVTIKVENSSNQ
jgi:hypothetical protein